MSDIPEPIKTYHEKQATIEKAMYSHDLVVKEAYLAGMKTLRDEKGFYDPEKVKDPSNIEKANEAMVEVFKKAAKKQYGFDADTFEYSREDLNGNTQRDNIDFVLKMYTGQSAISHKEKLKQALELDPLSFSENEYTGVVLKGHKEALAGSLMPYAVSHFTNDDIGSIFDFVHEKHSLEGIIDRDTLTLDGAIELLQLSQHATDIGQTLNKHSIRNHFQQRYSPLPPYVNRNGHQKPGDVNDDLRDLVEQYSGIQEAPQPSEEELLQNELNRTEMQIENGDISMDHVIHFCNQAMAGDDEKQKLFAEKLIERLQEKGMLRMQEEAPQETPAPAVEQTTEESDSEEENTEEEVPQEE